MLKRLQKLFPRPKQPDETALMAEYLSQRFSGDALSIDLYPVRGKGIGLMSELEIEVESSFPDFLKARIHIVDGCYYVIDEEENSHYVESPNNNLIPLGEVIHEWETRPIKGFFTITDDIGRQTKGSFDCGTESRRTNYQGSELSALSFMKDNYQMAEQFGLPSPFYVFNKNPIIYAGFKGNLVKEEIDRLQLPSP